MSGFILRHHLVWPDWAIFKVLGNKAPCKCSPNILQQFWAIVKNCTFRSNWCGYILGNFCRKFGYFLLQHLRSNWATISKVKKGFMALVPGWRAGRRDRRGRRRRCRREASSIARRRPSGLWSRLILQTGLRLQAWLTWCHLKWNHSMLQPIRFKCRRDHCKVTTYLTALMHLCKLNLN